MMTTLRKTDGIYTMNLHETINCMLDSFVPQDDESNDSEYHKQIRLETKEAPNTPHDIQFTKEEIRSILEGIDHKKAPGEDGITSNVLQHTFKHT